MTQSIPQTLPVSWPGQTLLQKVLRVCSDGALGRLPQLGLGGQQEPVNPHGMKEAQIPLFSAQQHCTKI